MDRRRWPQWSIVWTVPLLLALAAGRLTGPTILGSTPVRAQGAADWSAPALLYAGAANSFQSALVADQYGAAHLVFTLADDEATYYYSRWDGTGWTTPLDVLVGTHPWGVGVPSLVAAADGRLHLFWATDYVMHSWAWADAAGSARAWSAPEAIVYPDRSASGPVCARQDLSGTLHLVYALGTGDVYYTRFDGDGLKWSEPSRVSQVTPDRTAAGPRLDIGPDGRVHVVWAEYPWEEGPSRLGEVYYAHSDDGVSWSTPRRLGELANSGGNVLAAGDGTVYLAWQAGIASRTPGRFLQRSTDGGENWEVPLNFSTTVGQSGYPGMALDAAGTLHVITGEGEYVRWDGQTISEPADLRPLDEQTENSRLVVVSGNQLLAVVRPFLSPGVYYSVRQLSLTALPTAGPPARPAATRVPTPTTAATSTRPATAATSTGQGFSGPPRVSVDSFNTPALLLSAGLSLALVLAVVIIQLSRRRH